MGGCDVIGHAALGPKPEKSGLAPHLFRAGAFLVVLSAMLVIVVLAYGSIWVQAYMSKARVSILDLIGMSFRQVNVRVIVQAKIMAVQAGSAGMRRRASPTGGWRPSILPAETCGK